jgi:carbamoylphosphate synthase small subunit
MTGGYVLLEDGSRFDGADLCGHAEPATGEVVFNRSRSPIPPTPGR